MCKGGSAVGGPGSTQQLQNQAQTYTQNQASNQGQSSNQNQAQTYSANPAVQQAGLQALNEATALQGSPFPIPVAPVANFSNDQQSAFDQIRQTQGFAQPYFNQASNYVNQSAQPTTAGQINADTQQYLNPFAHYVAQNMQDQFGRQMQQTTGGLQQAAGGIGADRIGVAQAELAKQQDLALGQTMAGIYGTAQQAAQGQANLNSQRQANAGYAMGSFGPAAQNAQLQGIQAELGAGGLQQQLSQAQLNAPYQQQLAQLSAPYQQTQFLAGLAGGLGPTLGGTTTGQGSASQQATGLTQGWGGQNVNNFGVTTPPAPSMASQIFGGATAGVGLLGQTGAFGQNGWMGGVGKGSGNNFAQTGAPYASGSGGYNGEGPFLPNAAGGRIYARGGSIRFADGGSPDNPFMVDSPSTVPDLIPDIPFQNSGANSHAIAPMAETALQMPAMGASPSLAAMPSLPSTQSSQGQAAQGQSSSSSGGLGDVLKFASTVLPFFLNKGGRISTGGAVSPFHAMSGYAAGGSPDFDDAFSQFADATPPRGGFAPVAAPAGDNAIDATDIVLRDHGLGQKWQPSNPALDADAGVTASSPNGDAALSFAPQGGQRGPMAGSYSPPDATDPGATAHPSGSATGSNYPIQDFTGKRDDAASKLAANPWMALTAAGLGIMGGTSPFAGVNIGKGAMEGVKTLETQRTAAQSDRKIDLEAKKLLDEAEHWRTGYEKMTPYQAAEVGLKKQQHEDQYNRVPATTQAQLDQQKQFHEDQYGRMTPAQRATADLAAKAHEDLYERETMQQKIEERKPQTVAPGQTLVTRDGKVIFKNNSNQFDSDTLSDLADQYLAGDKSVFQNLGRGAQGAENVLALRQRVAERARAQGLTGAQIAVKMAEFGGLAAAERTLGTRGTNIDMAVNEANKLAPLALSASQAVDRTQYPTLNSLLLAAEKGTGDENVVRLGIATNSLINVYARAINPTGVATVSDKDHARELLATAWSKGQYAAGIDQLQKEMAAAQSSPGEVKEGLRNRYGGNKPEGAAAAPPAAPERPSSVPPGSAYSPSRKMWRSLDGQMFDSSGKPVQ